MIEERFMPRPCLLLEEGTGGGGLGTLMQTEKIAHPRAQRPRTSGIQFLDLRVANTSHEHSKSGFQEGWHPAGALEQNAKKS